MTLWWCRDAMENADDVDDADKPTEQHGMKQTLVKTAANEWRVEQCAGRRFEPTTTWCFVRRQILL